MSYNISKYGLPKKYTACPGCGKQYGHGGTKVDINSQECSKCAKERGYSDIKLVDVEEFIKDLL